MPVVQLAQLNFRIEICRWIAPFAFRKYDAIIWSYVSSFAWENWPKRFLSVRQREKVQALLPDCAVGL
jgi:hypothetical protein